MAVDPAILSIALSNTPLVLSHVAVSNSEGVHALAMTEALFPLTLIGVLVSPDMLAKTVGAIQCPLADVTITS